MSDYIFIRKSRNILSSITHILFNIALGVGSIALTIVTNSWLLGILLVLLSKWRMFAVRPRFWLVNLKSNLVDLIVGASFVFIAYCAGNSILPVHYLLATFYVLWLIILKPMSTPLATRLQALAAVFLGSTAATFMTANIDVSLLCLSCFIIGYGAARHVLIQSDDTDFTIITLTCGLIAAEIAWLCHSWLIVYMFNQTPIGSTGIIIPQLAIILTILAYAFGAVHQAILNRDGHLKWQDVAMPVIFSTLLLSIIVIWFSQPIFNV